MLRSRAELPSRQRVRVGTIPGTGSSSWGHGADMGTPVPPTASVGGRRCAGDFLGRWDRNLRAPHDVQAQPAPPGRLQVPQAAAAAACSRGGCEKRGEKGLGAGRGAVAALCPCPPLGQVSQAVSHSPRGWWWHLRDTARFTCPGVGWAGEIPPSHKNGTSWEHKSS